MMSKGAKEAQNLNLGDFNSSVIEITKQIFSKNSSNSWQNTQNIVKNTNVETILKRQSIIKISDKK